MQFQGKVEVVTVGQMVTIPPAPRVKTRVKVAAYCRVSDLTGRLPGSLAAQVASADLPEATSPKPATAA